MIELFFKHPIGTIGYAFLILALLSIWIHRKIWVWAPLLCFSFAFAYYGDIVELSCIIPIILAGGCYFFSSEDISGFWRLFSTLFAAIITVAMYTHFIKGFNNILLFSNWRSSANAIPMNIYANYDKGVLGLLLLGIYVPVIQSRKAFIKMLISTIPWTVLTGLVILTLSNYLNIIAWDPKLPFITLTWLTVQLFFVVIPEEVFYRGFIQNEIAKNLNNRFSGVLAVLITSLLFALLHLFFIPNLSFIIVVFVTSLFYGGIYQITQKIESSIITHLVTNVCHFFFFTYPMLISAT